MKDVRALLEMNAFSKILGKPLKSWLIIIPAQIIMLASPCFAQILMDVNCENYCENIEIDPAIDPDSINVCYPNCSYAGFGCLPPGYPCDYGYECCSYYCSGGSNGVCYDDTDCPGYNTGEQVCCAGICQSTCEPGSNSGSSGSYAGTCKLVANP